MIAIIIIIIICIRHPTEHHHNYFFTLLFAVSTVVVDPDPRMVGSAIVFLALLPPDRLSLVVSTRLVGRLVPVVGLLPIPVEEGSSLGIAWFDRLLFIARLFIARVFMSTLD
jgi:hypothetical protein